MLNVALGQADRAYIYGTDYPTPDGTCIRDYIHIADLVAAHILAVEQLANRDSLVYNVDSGNGFSFREVIDTASAVVGKQIPVREMPRRPGDSARLVASSEKTRRELGWRPQHDNLHDIISGSWEWHQQHPHGYGVVSDR